jgi:hypothetical protein
MSPRRLPVRGRQRPYRRLLNAKIRDPKFMLPAFRRAGLKGINAARKRSRRTQYGWNLKMSSKGVQTETLNETAVPVGLGLTYNHPSELLEDECVDRNAKRALLASWASDRHTIASAPALRQLESGAIVKLTDILDALKSLDRSAVSIAAPKPSRPAFRLLRRPMPMRLPRKHQDDDPPPRPVRMKIGGLTVREL